MFAHDGVDPAVAIDEDGVTFYIAPQEGPEASVAGFNPFLAGGGTTGPGGGGASGGNGGGGGAGGTAPPGPAGGSTGGGSTGGGSTGGTPSSGGGIFGHLLPAGSSEPARYDRYAFLPVLKQNDVGTDLSVEFDLDPASAAYVASSGGDVRYKFSVQVWNIQRNSWGAPNHFVVDSSFTVTTSNVAVIPAYAANDRMIVVTAVAQLMKNGQVVRSSPYYQVLAKTPLTTPVVEQIPALAQTIANMFHQVGNKASALFQPITTNTGAFLRALGDGVSGAFEEYLGHWQENLLDPFLTWLGGGISLPDVTNFTPNDVVPFLLQYSGLTWDNIQNIALKELGEGNVAAVKKLADTVFNGLDLTKPSSLLTFLGRLPGLDLGGLTSKALNALAYNAGTAIVQLVPELLGKFFPGPGNVFAMYQAAQRGLTWLLDNQSQVQALFDKLIEGIDSLITPSAAGVKAALLGAMTKENAATLISLAASQLGLDKLKKQLKDALEFIPAAVEKAVRSTVRSLVSTLNTALNPVYHGRLADIRTFSYRNKTYSLFAARDSEAIRVKIVEQSAGLHKLVKVLEAKDFATAAAVTHLADYKAKAAALAAAAKGKPRGKKPNAAEPGLMAGLKEKQAAMTAAEDVLVQDILANACKALLTGCFAAGTKILTRAGWKNVEEVELGDEVASRPELDPRGAIEWKPVEETFNRTGRILHLHLAGGRLIRTTPEHPFWVDGAGWAVAGELKPGDRLATQSGEWCEVEEAFDTGEHERVYNCRVADHHTYFVGGDGWSAAIWAHNEYAALVNEAVRQAVAATAGQAQAGAGFSKEAARTGARAEWASETYVYQHIYAMLGKYYPAVTGEARDSIAKCAANRVMRLQPVLTVRGSHTPEEFIPRNVETYHPTSPVVPAALSSIAHRQYSISNPVLGVLNLAPITADLNNGGWEVKLATDLGDTPQKKAFGVYIIRDTVTGRIYKVGKVAKGQSFGGRLESYAKDFMAHGIVEGTNVRITAEVYKLPSIERAAERVLRYVVTREDGWPLDHESGAADGTWNQVSQPGTIEAAGWQISRSS